MISSARFTFHDLAPGEESFRDAVLRGLRRAPKSIVGAEKSPNSIEGIAGLIHLRSIGRGTGAPATGCFAMEVCGVGELGALGGK